MSFILPARRPVRRRRPGRPCDADSEALRELYLQAALDTFLARGYAGASVEEIARVAKAGKTTFYRQFGNKAELFRLAAHYAIGKVRSRLQHPLVAGSAPEQVVPEIVSRLHIGLTDPEYLAVLRLVIAESERFPELSEALLRDDHYMLEPVVDYLSRATAEGLLAVPDPYAATMQLAALAIGGTRSLIKKPRTDAASRAHWVAAVSQFALAAWRPAASGKPARRR